MFNKWSSKRENKWKGEKVKTNEKGKKLRMHDWSETLVTEKNAQNKNCMKSLVIILTRNHATFDDKYSLDA